MFVSRDKRSEQNVSNIVLAFGQRFNKQLFKKKKCFVFFCLSFESLSYSNLCEHFRTKLQDLI